MVGIHRSTGETLDGWAHVEQSIIDIFTTLIGTRVIRRDYGSNIPDLIDRPQNRDLILEVALEGGEALDKWEPRFRLRGLGIEQAGGDGRVAIDLVGDHYPRGHLGDWSIVENDRGVRIYL